MEEGMVSKSEFLGGSGAKPTLKFGSKLSLGLAGGGSIYYKVRAGGLLGQSRAVDLNPLKAS